jgi:hypothetical protein
MSKKIEREERLAEIREHLFIAGKYRDLETTELSKAWTKLNNITKEVK